MASKQRDRPAVQPDSRANPTRWLGIGGGVALMLALLAVLLAWQTASDERRASEDVEARVAAEMNRIEAEAQRIEREAAR
jgi:hypothetical protein